MTIGSRWAIEETTVIDGRENPPVTGQDVVIAGDRIELVAPRAGRDLEPRAVLSGRGRWVMPGLIDTHVHSTFPSEMEVYLRNSVTSIRYAGNPLDRIAVIRQRVDSGEIRGPRIHSCGPMIDGELPSYPDLSAVVHDRDEAQALARRLIGTGAVDSLLVVQHITAELLGPIVHEAHQAGLPVFGQTWLLDGADAAREGIDQLDNTSRIFVSPLVPESSIRGVTDIPRRLRMLRVGWMSVDWDQTARLMETLVQHAVSYCPTLVRTQWVAGTSPGTMAALGGDRDAGLFGSEELEAWSGRVARASDGPPSTTERDEWRHVIDGVVEWIRRFRDLGGRVVAGTDCQFGGILLHDELTNLRTAGLTPLEAIAAATGWAGDALGVSPEVGSLVPGAAADLVVLPRDPLIHPSAMRDPELVVVGGRVVLDSRSHVAPGGTPWTSTIA